MIGAGSSVTASALLHSWTDTTVDTTVMFGSEGGGVRNEPMVGYTPTTKSRQPNDDKALVSSEGSKTDDVVSFAMPT